MKKNDILIQYFCKDSKTPIITLDKDNLIIECNEAFKNIVMEKGNPLNRPFKDFIIIESVFDTQKYEKYIKSKTTCTYNSNKSSVTTFDGSIIATDSMKLIVFEKYLISNYDIIEQMSKMNVEMSDLTRDLSKKNRDIKIAYDKIAKIVNTDYLTQIYNRKYFFDRLSEIVSLRNRTKNFDFGVIMIDIDYFKRINDKFGHDVGDTVLIKLSTEIQNNIREEDIFARIGGEEFCILARVENIATLTLLAEKLRAMCELCDFTPVSETITASFGVTLYNSKDSIDTIMKRVDEALYNAKREGRNKVYSI